MDWAYGVVATFLPHKGGAVPESEKRRAAWCTISTSHTFLFVSLLSSGCSAQALPGAHDWLRWNWQKRLREHDHDAVVAVKVQGRERERPTA